MPSKRNFDEGSEVTPSGDVEPNMFEMLCDNVHTSMLTYNATLQEFFEFKDELLKHALPPKLLVNLTLLSSRLFRSFSEFCVPVNELSRMVRLHSAPWQEKAGNLESIRADYESMQRKLNIALKRIEMMAAEEEKIKRERRLVNWERLFNKTMESESHGRRWKYRIGPLKQKMQQGGFNPYLSDSSGDESDEDYRDRERLSPQESSDDELKDIDSDDESDAERRSSGMLSGNKDLPQATPTPAPTPIVTAETSTSTEDPDYDNYLLIQLYRPNGLLTGKDVCCSLAYGQEFYTSQVYPGKTAPGSLLAHQSFHFQLTDDAARTLPPDFQQPLDSIDIPKVTLTIYPNNIAEDMAAYVSLPLGDLHVTDESTDIVPADSSKEKFEVNWDDVDSKVHGFPKEYHLKVQAQQKETTEELEEPDIALIPLVCHRVKVQRHKKMHIGTETMAWEMLLSELGYRLIPDTQSRAVSMICFEDPPQQPKEEEPPEEDKISKEEMAALTLQHADEIQKLQEEFGRKLSSLTRTLAKVKTEKSREIEQLEQALVEAEQSKGRRGKSVADIRSLLARKKKMQITHGLPNWGQDLPEDFFERMELFAEESVKKQEELTERIKREVSQACEKQLATHHRLAPGLRTDIDTTTEDVSLPALFMPTHCTKNNVYTPRAHKYFHPPGSTDARVTQPPSVFKLPALNSNHLHTLNLFELSQQYNQTGPQWLREHAHQSPRYTPAPPPSACGYYHQLQHTSHMTSPQAIDDSNANIGQVDSIHKTE